MRDWRKGAVWCTPNQIHVIKFNFRLWYLRKSVAVGAVWALPAHREVSGHVELGVFPVWRGEVARLAGKDARVEDDQVLRAQDDPINYSYSTFCDGVKMRIKT